MTPAPGVIDCNKLDHSIYDIIDAGIDLYYEEAKHELLYNLEEGSDEYESALQELNDKWEPSAVVYLVGDWKKTPNGYEIDKEGKTGWAGTYNNGNGSTLVVEWSKHTTFCQPTSPCYRRRTGGPCGNLDSPGGEVEAYALPSVYALV